MPRIPDGLGVRPVPQARLAIVSQRNAGDAATAAARFGEVVAGQVQKQWEKQDKLSYAFAKADFLAASEKAKREFQDDPDYDTFDERYRKAMELARTEALKKIQTQFDRAIFEAETQVLTEQNATAVLDLARGKRVDAGRALFAESGDKMLDGVAGASDAFGALESISTFNEMADAAVGQGLYTKAEAVKVKQDWAAAAVRSRLDNAFARDAYDEASAIFNGMRDALPWQERAQYQSKLNEAFEHREDVDIVTGLLGAMVPGEAPAVNYGDPLRGKGQAPVPGGQYGAPRDYGGHKGVDHPAAMGTSVYSMGPGVATISKSEKGGNIVTIKHYDGRTSRYMHLGSVAVKDGDRVTPDTMIGTVGMTGRTTGPHLHLEVIEANGSEVDPDTVIGQAAQPGGQRDIDLRGAYAGLDAMAAEEGWTPERLERAKQVADIEVRRREGLQAREDSVAYDQALAVASALGGNFTSTSQIPNYGQLPVQQRITLQNMAEANVRAQAAAAGAPANGDAIRILHRMAIEEPEKFAALDLRPFQPYMTAGEFDEVGTSQARVVKEAQGWSPRTLIQNAISWGANFGGVKLDDGEEKYRVYRFMEQRAAEYREQAGKAPGEKEMQGFFREATQNITFKTSFLGIGTGATQERAFEASEATKPFREMIIRQFRAVHGKNPTEKEIQEWYDRMGKAIE